MQSGFIKIIYNKRLYRFHWVHHVIQTAIEYWYVRAMRHLERIWGMMRRRSNDWGMDSVHSNNVKNKQKPLCSIFQTSSKILICSLCLLLIGHCCTLPKEYVSLSVYAGLYEQRRASKVNNLEDWRHILCDHGLLRKD